MLNRRTSCLQHFTPTATSTPWVCQLSISSTLNKPLFAAAPFIGLVYAMALPLVGLVMLALAAYRAFAKSSAKAAVKNVVLLAAAPFIGLAYAVAMPFVGIAMIAKIGYQAYRAPVQAA